jgi:predicted nucleotidyltransferase
LSPACALEDLLGRLRPILEHAPIEFSLLFGSGGRGEAFRDLDLAVQFKQDHGGLREMLDLGVRLERAAGVRLDLISLSQATVAFQFEVSKGALLTSQDIECFYDWRERTWSSYFAIEHLLRSHALEYARVYGASP